jgi:hypothetical protein
MVAKSDSFQANGSGFKLHRSEMLVPLASEVACEASRHINI